MAAEENTVVLRIKRKRTEDPLDALLVAQLYKKPKPCLASSDSSTEGPSVSTDEQGTVERVFRFVGTVPHGDNEKRKDLLTKLHKQTDSHHKNLSKTHIHDNETLQERLREKKKLLHQEARFKVISAHRPNDNIESESDIKTKQYNGADNSLMVGTSDDVLDDVDLEVKRLFSVYDLVKDENTKEREGQKERKARKEHQAEDVNTILCNSVRMIREKLTVSEDQQQKKESDGFVYDFYCPNDTYGRLGDIVEVLPFDSELVHERLAEDFGELYDDEDDSNDEGNWRNDYPDEEDSGSDTSLRRYYEDYGFDSDEEYRRYAFGDDRSSDDD